MRGLRVVAAVLVLGMSAPCLGQSYHDLVDASEGFNGVALVGTGKHVSFVKGIGWADAGNGVPMLANTRFETGSVSKWIASIVILRLVDQGKLDIDAPITRYLPDYRADTGARLTLRRLMSHSSGLPNQLQEARKDVQSRGVELEQMEAVRRYASGDLAFEPGTAWDYSHSNWVLAKAIVERVTDKPYAALVDQLLVRPLRLKDSGVYRGDSGAVTGIAQGYAGLDPRPVRKPNPVPDFMAMAGGYYTSAPDLMTLMNAVLDGKLLSPASRKALMTTLMPDQHYALGGRVRIEKIGSTEREAAWEDGSNGGFRMLARRVLADGHTVIVFTNASFDYQKLGDLGTKLLDASYAGENGSSDLGD
ncbi:CubicO group peptidase (beta-lactamase class C family) [Sphingomonas kyeonggiensis]|uniref:serine hydrolase domain-containing protein n=1 Tax=Sphingomonas kyeonggiensis TaxID=1268553 RepID=UPI00278020FD|nr:serine hydrolase domain-containing protein [Sphingomonas kyeonggiensis]MDQ0250552.1 CubicO group peptidase (beta-lactamase class C family) [Sphingomonas kyeonggiensis]